MSVVRRLSSLNVLVAVMGRLYPPLVYVPFGAFSAMVLLLTGLLAANHYGVAPVMRQNLARKAPGAGRGKPIEVPKDSKRLPIDALLSDKEGRLVSVKHLLGQRTLMYVYSPHCGHCNNRLPQFASYVHRRVPLETNVVGIQYRGGRLTLTGSSGDRSPGVLVADPDGNYSGSIGVNEFTVFVLGPEGEILHRSGGEDLDPLLALLE